MRFFENGPSIPDDLLVARDEGRVVFVCGAGVSMSRARLVGFFDLAAKVIGRLGVSASSSAFRVFSKIPELEDHLGERGLVSMDRVFGLLERDEFLITDIEAEVAKALQPQPAADLSAHRILLELATTPEGKVRLVTTNFDRLFEGCDDTLPIWQPPRLPDLSRQDEMHGIVYLHGRAKEDYSGPEGDGFVLTSSQFGRAYLAEGWATEFFREIIERYIVVFVGYAADDPPVHYLLEALNKKAGQLSGVYAFQADGVGGALASWQHKGVEVIGYESRDNHKALWETLAAWATRAKAPELWRQAVIELARKGPEDLSLHERGQVAHIVSTVEGAREFAESDEVPPAEWLCVFDPHRRYAKPGEKEGVFLGGPYVDPFDLYGLDSDTAPGRINPDDHHTKREVPQNSWDGFAVSRSDRQNLNDDNYAVFRGYRAANMPIRQRHLGQWLGRVAGQPASVWWAARQTSLHPHIQSMVQWQFQHSKEDVQPDVRRAWEYLFEAWENRREDPLRDWHALKTAISKKGWSSVVLRQYAAMMRPTRKVGRNYIGGPTPPARDEDVRHNDLLKVDVAYPAVHDKVEIPDEWLAAVIKEQRKNLEEAIRLETENGDSRLGVLIRRITPNDLPEGDSDFHNGLESYSIAFSSLFARLLKVDISAARREMMAWPDDDDTIFSRLRVWSSGYADLIPVCDFVPIITGLSEDSFWNVYNRRNIMLVLARRWHEISGENLQQIENRLLNGPPRWKNEEEADFEERWAREVLNCVTWLAGKGCRFTFDLAIETAKLSAKVPGWNPGEATHIVEPLLARSGRIQPETEHSSLSKVPLGAILAEARSLSGRTGDFFVEKDPFQGLSAERPIRAFSALTDAARKDEYPEWAWRTFLYSDARNKDKTKLSALIAERICRYPDEAVSRFLQPATGWLKNISAQLASNYPLTFEKIISKLIHLIQLHLEAGHSAVIRGSRAPDWASEALNSPVGKIAQALLDSRKEKPNANEGLPATWQTQVEALLSLDGDLRRYALVIFTYFLNWFYHVAPAWTETHLLSVLDGDDETDRDAFWDGFLWRADLPGPKLYTRIKPGLIAFAKGQPSDKNRQAEIVAGLILAGWKSLNQETQERFVSDMEMREVLLLAGDEFRSQILWRLRDKSNQEEKEEAGNNAILLEFLRNVWPRQKSVRTPAMTSALCSLAFANRKCFPELVEIILPFLMPGKLGHLLLPDLTESRPNLVDRYPGQTLALLFAVLPDNTADWPYGAGETLKRIGEVEGSLQKDSKWLELTRRWNAR